MNKREVQDMIERAARQSIPYEPAPLEREDVQGIIENMCLRFAKVLGVTVVEDHSGAWGPAGQTHVTVRFSDPETPDGDLVEVGMVVTRVTSLFADRQHNDDRRATPK